MKIKPLLYGQIYNGDIIWNDTQAKINHLNKLGDGIDVQILIEKRKNTRSLNQNRYYWGCVIDLLCDAFGWIDNEGPEEMHEYLKSKFLARQRGEITTFRSSASLTTAEFEEYMTAIRMWASAEHGVYIPEPNEPSIQSIYFN